MRDSMDEYQILDFSRRKPAPGPADHQKNGFAAAVSDASADVSRIRQSENRAIWGLVFVLVCAVALYGLIAAWWWL